MPIHHRRVRMRDEVTFHIAVCDIDVVRQVAQWILEDVAVWSQVHFERCARLHSVLDDRHWAQAITATFSVQFGVVIASLHIDCGLPWQQNLVVMIHPSACDISVPIIDIELCVSHAHCTQVFLDSRQAVLVRWIR